MWSLTFGLDLRSNDSKILTLCPLIVVLSKVLRCRYKTTVYFTFLIFLDGSGYELDGPEFEYWLVEIFSYPDTFRPAPRSHQASNSMDALIISQG